WLPSHVLDEAIWETKIKKDDVNCNYHRHRSKLPAQPFFQPWRGSWRRHQKPRYCGNGGASGGPGMQAFFLDSGQKSCGTGVFLPQRAGTISHSSRRPACSPVLLPSRVVQALNLNVHELGLQISPRHPRNNTSTRRGELNNSLNNNSNNGNKNGKDHASTKRCVVSQTETSSADIFLPREWTY
ncbi:hypothetical protein ES332_A08G081200v1, partial [Gossypium tomentosum]